MRPAQSTAASAIVVGTGVLVLVGWKLDIASLRSVFPGHVTMKPNSALAFVLTGLSLWLQRDALLVGSGRRTGRALAAGAGVLGLLTLCEYSLGFDLGIDQLLFREPAGAIATSHPGRMAPVTALSFVLLGLALVLLDVETRRGRHPAQWLTFAVLPLPLLALTGHLYGTQPLYRIASYTAMALHTALALLVLCLGILWSRPQYGLMKTITDGSAAGMLVRRLLPAVVVVPIVFGWLRLVGQKRGLFDLEYGLSLMVAATILMLSALIGWTARSVEAVESRHQETSKNEARRFRELTESLPQLVWTCQPDGPCDYLSRQWVEYTGIPEAAQLGSGWLEQLHPDDREPTLDAWNRAGESGLDVEFRIRRADGAYRWFKTRAVALHDADGKIVKWFGSNTDIDDHKRLEADIRELNAELEQRVRERIVELEAANKELESFSYSVSHDLRAPLRHLDGFAKLLLQREGSRLDETSARYVSTIVNSSNRMGELIDNLLEFSRTGRAPVHVRRVDLNKLVGEVRRDLDPAMEGRRITWVVASLPAVEADPVLLRAVLTNLLANAIKFTARRAEPQIEIGATTDVCGEVVIFVRDDGVGFDPRYVDKLFGVFQRLHRNEEFPGTGIGLATVRRVIHRHGGRVWATGEPDAGATFYFTLPDAAIRADASAA